MATECLSEPCSPKPSLPVSATPHPTSLKFMAVQRLWTSQEPSHTAFPTLPLPSAWLPQARTQAGQVQAWKQSAQAFVPGAEVHAADKCPESLEKRNVLGNLFRQVMPTSHVLQICWRSASDCQSGAMKSNFQVLAEKISGLQIPSPSALGVALLSKGSLGRRLAAMHPTWESTRTGNFQSLRTDCVALRPVEQVSLQLPTGNRGAHGREVHGVARHERRDLKRRHITPYQTLHIIHRNMHTLCFALLCEGKRQRQAALPTPIPILGGGAWLCGNRCPACSLT